MNMIPQSKGKMIKDIPISKLDTKSLYFYSIKRDGNYLQIRKIGDKVFFYTSGNKQIYFEDVANFLIEKFKGVDITLACEYTGNSVGMLGNRVHASTGTERANFTKGIRSNLGTRYLYIFDILEYTVHGVGQYVDDNTTAEVRVELLTHLGSHWHNDETMMFFLSYFTLATIDEIKQEMIEMCSVGYEGLYAMATNHTNKAGKRLNNAIKFKLRCTADLLCIGIEEGKGKYANMIGALILEDSKGRVVSVGSGLTDSQRHIGNTNCYLHKVVEIEYEQLLDTYIQPVYLCLRDDKSSGDID